MNIRDCLAGFILLVVAITESSAAAGGGQQEQLIVVSDIADTLDSAHEKLAAALARREACLHFPLRETCTAFVTAAAGGGQQEQLITARGPEAQLRLSPSADFASDSTDTFDGAQGKLAAALARRETCLRFPSREVCTAFVTGAAGGGQQEQLITARGPEAQLRLSPSADFVPDSADPLDSAHEKLATALARREACLRFPSREACAAFVTAAAGGGQQEQLITARGPEAQLRLSPSADFVSDGTDTFDSAHEKLAAALARREACLHFPLREACAAFVTGAAGGSQQEQLITAWGQEAQLRMSPY